MKSPPATVAENPLKAVSRGEADFVFQLALLARQDADDVRQFLFETVALWATLARELDHPRRFPHA